MRPAKAHGCHVRETFEELLPEMALIGKKEQHEGRSKKREQQIGTRIQLCQIMFEPLSKFDLRF